MGSSLHFLNLRDEDVVDADRVGIAKFLAANDLHVEGEASDSAIFDSSGQLLAFDGFRSDVRIDPLDQQDPVTGEIDHATLTASECAFIYGLCVAGRMMVVNPQGDPMYIVVGHTHSEDDVLDPDDTVWGNSLEELANALGAGFWEFRVFLQNVRAKHDSAESPPPDDPVSQQRPGSCAVARSASTRSYPPSARRGLDTVDDAGMERPLWAGWFVFLPASSASGCRSRPILVATISPWVQASSGTALPATVS